MNESVEQERPAKRMDRWSTPKKYDCTHEGCNKAALILEQSTDRVHNCCTEHDEIANTALVLEIAARNAERWAGTLRILGEA